MPFIDIGNVTEPVKVFVERVSDLIGGALLPMQIRRIAAAEADAKIVETVADLQAESIRRRTAQRWLAEEEAKQMNMEAIAAAAIPQIGVNARPEKIERDWLANFFDKSRLTSDEEMQKLWAKILAGEANAPGKFSKRAINAMGLLDKNDAERFQRVCRFVCSIESGSSVGLYPLVFHAYRDAELNRLYEETGVREGVVYLEEMGLVRTGEVGEPDNVFPDPNSVRILPGTRCRYHDQSFEFRFNGAQLDLDFGSIFLTKTGEELATICAGGPLPAFWEALKKYWSSLISLSPSDGK